MDDRRSSPSNVDQQALESLPTINRGLEDFARTNPFFLTSAENEDEEAISVAGRSSRYNISIDGAVNNDLFGLSDSGSRVAASTQLDAYISADAGLDAHRGQIVPRNASVAPWSHSFDLRVAQEIPIQRSSLQLTFDIVNLGTSSTAIPAC